MTTISCTVYGPSAPESGFDALASEWNDLLQRTRFNSFFLTHEWQTIWWHNLGKGDLWILAFFDHGSAPASMGLSSTGLSSTGLSSTGTFNIASSETGQSKPKPKLIGIAPLYCVTTTTKGAGTHGPNAGENVLALVGCTEVSDYLDLIIERGREEEVYRAFMHWLQSDAAPNWHRLDLCNLPEESQTYQQFPELLKQAPIGKLQTVDVSQEDVAPYFAIPATYETYLQTVVDKKQRHEMRRKQRRIEREAHCEFYIVGQENRLSQPRNPGGIMPENEVDCVMFEREMDDFLRLQMASREDKAEFMTDEMAAFFRNMACFMQRAGYLRLCFLRMNGVNAASVLAFEYDGRLWLYNSGYDPDVFAALSPGWVILSYTIQYAIATGLKVYDFMQGDEAYKYHFGGQDYKVMRVIVTR